MYGYVNNSLGRENIVICFYCILRYVLIPILYHLFYKFLAESTLPPPLPMYSYNLLTVLLL